MEFKQIRVRIQILSGRNTRAGTTFTECIEKYVFFLYTLRLSQRVTLAAAAHKGVTGMSLSVASIHCEVCRLLLQVLSIEGTSIEAPQA